MDRLGWVGTWKRCGMPVGMLMAWCLARCGGEMELEAVLPQTSPYISGYLPHSFLGSFFSGSHQNPRKKLVFPGSIAKGSSSKSGCQLHLPTSHANLSRVTSPANFSCQLVESYFTCQLLMPTCRELLHLLTSHANLSRVTSPAYFSCQLFGCYLILLKAQANLSGVTSLS